jgi:hypothetical protein
MRREGGLLLCLVGWWFSQSKWEHAKDWWLVHCNQPDFIRWELAHRFADPANRLTPCSYNHFASAQRMNKQIKLRSKLIDFKSLRS